MKRFVSTLFALVLAIALATPASASGNGSVGGALEITASDLSTEEAAALTYMREEEKLARDVYKKMYRVWGMPIFLNIAAAEQKHMDKIGILLVRYNLPDPAQAPGVFTDPVLQDLYNTLVARGSRSRIEALRAGGAIEELDILDLQTRLAQTDNPDIQQVFKNLLSASCNHLRAFARAYTNRTGKAYTAQYLTAEMLSAILSGWNCN
jgi:hypothetical protein